MLIINGSSATTLMEWISCWAAAKSILIHWGSRSPRRTAPNAAANGPEGDYHLLTPLEFHTDTSELFQMIQKGHHNVKLDAEAWSCLITWMDLNAPRHGTWKEAGANPNVLTQAAL